MNTKPRSDSKHISQSCSSQNENVKPFILQRESGRATSICVRSFLFGGDMKRFKPYQVEKILSRLKEAESRKLVSDGEVVNFIETNFQYKDKVDFEKMREILAVSRIYDQNYLRLVNAIKKDDKVLMADHRAVEALLDTLGAKLRSLARIRQPGEMS